MDEQAIAVTEEQKPLAVFGAEKPGDIVARATEVANVLAPIIEQKQLYKNINGRRHVMAEGWATLMGLLNVDPIVEYCRRIEREGEIAYEARVLLVKNGVTISAAETIASDKEKAAWSRSEQGVKSMAQTRAFGKACRLKFSWIIVLAGYAPTPAEEMGEDHPTIQPPRAKSVPVQPVDADIAEAFGEPPPELPPVGQDLFPKVISKKQQGLIFVKAKQANIPETVLRAHLIAAYGVEHTGDLTWKAMDPILAWIEKYAQPRKTAN